MGSKFHSKDRDTGISHRLISANPARCYNRTVLPLEKSKENDPEAIALADEEFTRLEKKKPNLKTWRASHAGKEIVVTNWWSMKGVSAAELTIDGKKVSRSTVITWDHQKPLLEGNSDEAGGFHTEVFFTVGVLKIKAAIVVNGEVILRDKTSWLDRLAGKVVSQSSDDEKT